MLKNGIVIMIVGVAIDVILRLYRVCIYDRKYGARWGKVSKILYIIDVTLEVGKGSCYEVGAFIGCVAMILFIITGNEALLKW